MSSGKQSRSQSKKNERVLAARLALIISRLLLQEKRAREEKANVAR